MSLTVVARVIEVVPHPNADRVEVIRISSSARIRIGLVDGYAETTTLVTGKHYRAGDLGVWLQPGASIPGWLANHLWEAGKKKASDSTYRFTVMEKQLRGIASPGLWIGKFYQTDTSAESHDHARELKEHGGIETFREGVSWITPPYWNPEWKVGDVVDAELGVEPA